MRYEPPVRNRRISIWQSAKFDNVRDRTTERNRPPEHRPPRTHRPAAKAPATLLAKLKDLVSRYSTFDYLGWVQCELQYLRYRIESRFPQYNDWTAQQPPDLSFGMIDYRLPSTCRIVLIGDWATHMTDNVALLRQALKKFEPDAIIHLGDVYYSGTPMECTRNASRSWTPWSVN